MNIEYELDGISVRDVKVLVSLTKWLRTPGTVDLDAPWVKRFEKENGRLPDLFDGAGGGLVSR